MAVGVILDLPALDAAGDFLWRREQGVNAHEALVDAEPREVFIIACLLVYWHWSVSKMLPDLRLYNCAVNRAVVDSVPTLAPNSASSNGVVPCARDWC